MNRIIAFVISFLLIPALGWGYVTLKEWSTYEVLTAADLNSNFTVIDGGLDSLENTKVSKTAVDDSAARVVRDSLNVLRPSLNDTINARIPSSFPLAWTGAWCDSASTNDSLKVQITRHTLLGDIEALFIFHALGVAEKVNIFIDTYLPNYISAIDSISIPIWTEATNGDDYLAFSVWDDSTAVRFKSKMSAGANDSLSGTARTVKYVTITNPGIVGGKFRLKGILNIKSDSAFVGQPTIYTTNR